MFLLYGRNGILLSFIPTAPFWMRENCCYTPYSLDSDGSRLSGCFFLAATGTFSFDCCGFNWDRFISGFRLFADLQVVGKMSKFFVDEFCFWMRRWSARPSLALVGVSILENGEVAISSFLVYWLTLFFNVVKVLS